MQTVYFLIKKIYINFQRGFPDDMTAWGLYFLTKCLQLIHSLQKIFSFKYAHTEMYRILFLLLKVPLNPIFTHL